MLIDVEILTKPFTALWQFFMTDKPVVTESTEYMPAGLWGRFNRVVYTVELPEGHPKRLSNSSTRQVYRTYDWDGGLTVAQADQTYKQMYFVLPQYEDDKFLEASNEVSIRDGAADVATERAIRVFDADDTNAAKKSYSTERQPVTDKPVRQSAKRTFN